MTSESVSVPILGHYIRSSEDPVEVIHKLGDRLYGIHLKDFAEQKKKTHGVILGKGHLDVPGVFKASSQGEVSGRRRVEP